MSNSNREDDRFGPPQQQETTDWSAPQHQPPTSNYPQPYSDPGATPSKVTLETSDYIAIACAFIPGVGQLMLGQTVKGLVVLGVSLVFCLGGGLISIASVIDAYLLANARKRRPVGDWEFFPDFQETFNL